MTSIPRSALSKALPQSKSSPGAIRLLASAMLAALAPTAWAADKSRPTEVAVVGTLRADAQCARLLRDAAERALDALGSTGGTAKLAYAEQIRLALEEARVPKTQARDAVAALRRVADEVGPSIPELATTVAFFDENAKAKMLAFCALPFDCSAGRRPESHLAFTGTGAGVLLAPVPGQEGPLRWAINTYSTLAQAAGEYHLMRWLMAGHALERLRPGTADRHYRTYAPTYDGTFPPPPGSLHTGFALVVMRMFLTRVKTRTFAAYFPDEAAANNEQARVDDFRLLGREREAAALFPELDLTEENYLERTDQLLGEIARTIESLAETN
jgi:hypothetical protein